MLASPPPGDHPEVTKDDVQVQLQTGMMLRVKFEIWFSKEIVNVEAW